MHDLALSIFSICLSKSIRLDILCVPRELNQIADSISKENNTDEWEVSMEFFLYLDSLLGPFSIDRFATSRNRKIKCYISKYFDFETEAVDCLTQFWGNDLYPQLV